MSKVKDLEATITSLFRKGTEMGYDDTEIEEFLEGIPFETLLQAVWDKSEPVYSYRADGEDEHCFDYRGTELFKQRGALLYEDVGDGGFWGPIVVAQSLELWLLEDMGFAIVAKHHVEDSATGYITEYRVYKGDDWWGSNMELDLEDFAQELRQMCGEHRQAMRPYRLAALQVRHELEEGHRIF